MTTVVTLLPAPIQRGASNGGGRIDHAHTAIEGREHTNRYASASSAAWYVESAETWARLGNYTISFPRLVSKSQNGQTEKVVDFASCKSVQLAVHLSATNKNETRAGDTAGLRDMKGLGSMSESIVPTPVDSVNLSAQIEHIREKLNQHLKSHPDRDMQQMIAATCDPKTSTDEQQLSCLKMWARVMKVQL